MLGLIWGTRPKETAELMMLIFLVGPAGSKGDASISASQGLSRGLGPLGGVVKEAWLSRWHLSRHPSCQGEELRKAQFKGPVLAGLNLRVQQQFRSSG